VVDEPLTVLGGFLSETTRKVRRILLGLGTLGIALRIFGIRVQEVSLLGTKITIAEERWLPLGVVVLLGYFTVTFGVYALSDLQRNRVAIRRVMVHSTPPGAIDALDARRSAVLLGVRALLDVFFPVVLAVVAAFLLHPWR
jgi:hypothetical protein